LPLAAPTYTKFDEKTGKEQKGFWSSLTDEQKNRLLPLQSSAVWVKKIDASGKISLMGSSLSGEAGTYEVVMDFMKYRIEDFSDAVTKEVIGSGYIGVGFRIKAQITTTKADLNLSGPFSVALEAKAGNLSGSLCVDVIGIDSESVTNLIPLTSALDQSSIQQILQGLAAIKSKIWDQGKDKDNTKITPHLIAIRQLKEKSIENVKGNFLGRSSVYNETSNGKVLEHYWKPNGNIDVKNQEKLLKIMDMNGLKTTLGDITMFLYSREFEPVRAKIVSQLEIDKKEIGKK
jgi:hypothetical protein